MPKFFQNSLIFLLFLGCYLGSEPIYAWINQEISMPNLQDEVLKIENEMLREELEHLQQSFKINQPAMNDAIYSKVLYRDALTFFDTIRIQKGSVEGVRESQAVINEKGLIGIINETKSHTSTVTLLTSLKINLSVKIEESFGLLKCNDKQELWVTNITSKNPIEIGAIVTTSGLTNVPGHIEIGKVTEIKKDDLGLVTEVQITPNVDWNDIHYVAIIQAGEA